MLEDANAGTVLRGAKRLSVSQPRQVAMCLGPEAGGGLDIREVPRRDPAAGEIEVAVAAASVNPIDVRRGGLRPKGVVARRSVKVPDGPGQ
jgi:hypothetical protein